MSPMIQTDTRDGRRILGLLDRTLTFSQNTLRFLVEQTLDIQDIFKRGVPYLSREEVDIVIADMLHDIPRLGRLDETSLNELDAAYFASFRKNLSSWLDHHSGSVLQIQVQRKVAQVLISSRTLLIRSLILNAESSESLPFELCSKLYSKSLLNVAAGALRTTR